MKSLRNALLRKHCSQRQIASVSQCLDWEAGDARKQPVTTTEAALQCELASEIKRSFIF